MTRLTTKSSQVIRTFGTFVFVLCFVLLQCLDVYAAATKVTLINTDYKRPDPAKYYTKYYYKNDSGEWIWKWSKAITEGNMHKYNLNRADGSQQWAYCIEPDKEMAENYEPTEADGDKYWNSLNSSQKTGVSLALKFGLEHNKFPAYGYSSLDSTAAYIATQCLVWEFKEGVRTTSDFDRTDVTNSSGNVRIPKATYYNVVKQNDTCLEIYNSILAAVKKYYKGASFTKKTSDEAKASPIVMKWNPTAGKFSVDVTDTNSCGLKKAALQEALGDAFSISRDGNKYTLTRTTAGTKTAYMNNYNSDMLDNRSGETQKCWTNTLKQPLMTGSSNPVNLYVTFQTEDTGYIKIVKKLEGVPEDEDVDLTKFRFVIKNSAGTTVYSGYPDALGNLKVRLATGKYTVSEALTSAQNKIFKAPSAQTVNVTTDHTSIVPLTCTFTNIRRDEPPTLIKVKLAINKIMEKNSIYNKGNNGEIKNVKFGLFSRDTDELIETLSLQNEGENTFETELEYGKYYVKELETDSSYVLDQNQYDFEFVSTGNNAVQTIKINNGKEIVNKPLPGQIIIRKLDATTKEPLSGAKYGLFYDGESNFSESKAIKTGITKDGELRFDSLVKGKYLIRELEAPEGYILNEEVKTAEVTEGSQTITVEAVNEPYTVIIDQEFVMPHAGGDGHMIYSMTGCIALLVGVWLLLNKVLSR